MFDFVRSHSRLMLGLMVLLIFPSFVFFGVQGYSRFMEDSARSVASVDGRAITRAEWDNAHQRGIERLRQQMPGVDAKLFDNPEMKRQSLDSLVRERVLFAAADKFTLMPGDTRLQTLFWNDPQFASLRSPDGRTVNRELLASQGMNEAMFVARLRQDIGVRQVLGGVTGSAFAPAAAASASLGALLQRREVQLQRFELAAYTGKVTPTDADIETYYKANEASFKAEEQATIEYVVLDLEVLMKGVATPEAELKNYYTQNLARYTATEERRASHILLKADKDTPAADKLTAKTRAQALLEEVRKNPKAFAELARKNSQDPGSAERGGDLDFFGRGAMVKPFEDAAFAMKEGEISNVIESDFGFHIIQLTAVRGGQAKPFEAVRAEIETEVRKAQAQRLYAEAAEKFTNTVYEQSDSLQPVIDKWKLDKRSASVKRAPTPGAAGPLASQKLLDAVFGNEVVRNKRNTEAVETAPNQLVAARIVTHTPARVLPLADVKDKVREKVVAAQAAALAKKDGEARLAELKKATDQSLPTSLTVSRGQAQGLPRQVVDAVLRADPASLPALLGVDVPELGYVLVKVLKVQPREAAPGGDAPLQAQYSQAWADAESQAYLEALKKRFKVEVKESAVAAAAAAASSATQ
jgi:peptidyl-prolyl cis-trans isomerase D